MILIDYSAISIATIVYALKTDPELEDDFKPRYGIHLILNSIRKHALKHKEKYGQVILCIDAPHSWRSDYFPYYKWSRKEKRKKSSIDWPLIYKIIDETKEAIKESFPYLVIEQDNCEADDIIGCLARYSDKHKIKTIIISNDKDFVQLHSDYVSQWKPVIDGFYNVPNKDKFFKEMIIRGDRDDGIPNIKSPDDIFVQGKRQKPIYKKEVEVWVNDREMKFLLEDNERATRYHRNDLLINLENTPIEYCLNIIEKYEGYKDVIPNKGKITKFLVEHQLVQLLGKINQF